MTHPLAFAAPFAVRAFRPALSSAQLRLPWAAGALAWGDQPPISRASAQTHNSRRLLRPASLSSVPEQGQQALQLQQVLCVTASSGSSVVGSATSTIGNPTTSLSSVSATSTSTCVYSNVPNAATGLPFFKFVAAGIWTAVALAGAAVAQVAL
ncbi:hypothetical protein RhiJN_26084 [Ceratobasidium sp. AG-Ba]|nr:hypothetical protein RhiJN_26084 [Ceratobasidium sp. AG-Ba]